MTNAEQAAEKILDDYNPTCLSSDPKFRIEAFQENQRERRINVVAAIIQSAMDAENKESREGYKSDVFKLTARLESTNAEAEKYLALAESQVKELAQLRTQLKAADEMREAIRMHQAERGVYAHRAMRDAEENYTKVKESGE